MKANAVSFYRQGYNCSQCIIKSAAERFNLKMSDDCLKMCQVINNGFGIGTTCSVIVAGIMVIGFMFDEATAKRLRIKLLDEFNSKYRTLNCCKLKANDCEKIINDVAELLEKIILGAK